MARVEDWDDDVGIADEGKQHPNIEERPAAGTDDDDDPKPNRRRSLGNRLQYLNRRVSRAERINSELQAELEAVRARDKSAGVAATLDDAENTIVNRISDAEKRQAAAIEAGESALAVRIGTEIAGLVARHTRLSEHREDLKARRADEDKRRTAGGRQALPDHAQEWLDDHQDWFSVDKDGRPAGDETQQTMTKAALRFERELAGKGYEQGSQRILAEISKRMQRAYPRFFGSDREDDDDDDEGKSQIVDREPEPARERNSRGQFTAEREQRPTSTSRFASATAGGTGATNGRRSIRMSPQQIQQAKLLGISPAQYAEGLPGGKYYNGD